MTDGLSDAPACAAAAAAVQSLRLVTSATVHSTAGARYNQYLQNDVFFFFHALQAMMCPLTIINTVH